MLKNIPNILTIIRFILIPVIFYFALQDNYIVAAIFLVLSGVTDVLDGHIARKYNCITNFGTLFDPLADKLTQISTLVVLVIQKVIPFWILLIVIAKELIMIVGASFLYHKDTIAIPSKWYGKLATVVFYIAIFFSMINKQFALNYSFDLYLYYIALALTIFALIMYLKVFISLQKDKKQA